MDAPSISGVHGIEGHRTARLPGAARRPLSHPPQELRASLPVAFGVDNDPLRLVAETPCRLVRQQLDGLRRPAFGRRQLLGGRAGELIDDEAPLCTLLDLEGAEVHSLDQPRR